MREAVLLTDYQISQVLHAPDLLGLLTHVEYGGQLVEESSPNLIEHLEFEPGLSWQHVISASKECAPDTASM